MKNYIQSGDVITVTASADVVSGSLQFVGTMLGIAATSARNGEEYELKIGGVYEVAKVAAQAWTLGAPIYLDGVIATTVDGGGANKKIGVAAAVAANPSGSGRVRLNTSF